MKKLIKSKKIYIILTIIAVAVIASFFALKNTNTLENFGGLIRRILRGDDEEESYIPAETGELQNPTSEYKLVQNTYVMSPDLSNMNKEATYYITNDGNSMHIVGRIDRVNPPETWYDYEDRKWANVVTVTDYNVAYWMWIPRYKYKRMDGTQELDIKFVDMDNNYKNKNGEIEQLDDSYILPDAFKFNDKDLPGYWVSKYEMTNSNNKNEIIKEIVADDKITVETSNTSSKDDKYTIYLDGVKSYEGTLPHTIEKLQSNKIYDVFVTKNYTALYRGQRAMVKVEVDTSNFDPESTYYITYDENGENPKIAGRLDKIDPPENWYDYAAKKWANVVTIKDSKISYWVWVPRYKYRKQDDTQTLEIIFVGTPTTNKNCGADYVVPDAFTFNGKQLKGFWVSKYEVTSENSQSECIRTTVKPSSITIHSSSTTASTDSKYNIFVDGVLQKENTTLPYTIENLTPDTEYDVCVTKGTTFLERNKIKTKQIIVDMDGLNKDCTYYVEYDSNDKMKGATYNSSGVITNIDTTKLTPISNNAPDGWFDYANKKWANIVIVKDGKISFWVWVPRYKYRTIGSTQGISDASATAIQEMDIQFIDNTVTKDNCGNNYKVPDAFTFADKELNGFWVCKYEVSGSASQTK